MLPSLSKVVLEMKTRMKAKMLSRLNLGIQTKKKVL
jgi:hypothetical protein